MPEAKAVGDSVPKEVVEASMKAFQEHYNSNDMNFCGKCYSDECHVTVNGGMCWGIGSFQDASGSGGIPGQAAE